MKLLQLKPLQLKPLLLKPLLLKPLLLKLLLLNKISIFIDEKRLALPAFFFALAPNSFCRENE